MSPRRRPRSWIRILAVLLPILALLALVLRRPATVVRTARVERSNLRVTVSCSGELSPPREGVLRAPEPGSVAALEVVEGTPVRQGQALLTVASPDLRAQWLAARSDVAELEAEHVAAAAGLVEARAELEARRRTADQDARLVEAGAISRGEAETSAAALRGAQERLKAATARAASVAPSDRASRLSLAQARLAELDRRMVSLTLRAPIDGTVFGLPHVGEPVSLGQQLGGLARPDHPRLRVQVDEPDVPRVAKGQRLLVVFDGLPGRQFEGSLLRLDPALRPSQGREVAEGEGELADPQHLLPLNAGVSVQIVVGERKDALVAPRGALLRDGDERYVLVVREGRAERRPVSVGLIGLSEVEMLEGLSAGEEVILPGATPIRPGQRVHVHGG